MLPSYSPARLRVWRSAGPQPPRPGPLPELPMPAGPLIVWSRSVVPGLGAGRRVPGLPTPPLAYIPLLLPSSLSFRGHRSKVQKKPILHGGWASIYDTAAATIAPGRVVAKAMPLRSTIRLSLFMMPTFPPRIPAHGWKVSYQLIVAVERQSCAALLDPHPDYTLGGRSGANILIEEVYHSSPGYKSASVL